jgi:S-ribosylhomocysteine lyase LuxS involved in autoinducer biosynthesis
MLRKEDIVKRQHKRFGSTRHNRFGTMISVVKDNDLRLTVPGQTALQRGQSHTLEKLDSAKKYVKPNRHAEIVSFSNSKQRLRYRMILTGLFSLPALQERF